MQIDPTSEEDLQADLVLPAGEYDFDVIEAIDKTSSSGNEMIALKLNVYGDNGGQHHVRDWLVSSDATLSKMKVRHFCRSCGLMESYDSGSLTALECSGASGRVQTSIQESEQYGTQARVRDYLMPEGYIPPPPAEAATEPTKGPTAAQEKKANKAEGKDGIPF